MVSSRNNQENEQKSARVLRRELMEKNDAKAPKKHKQCKALFLQYLNEKHPAAYHPRYMYPTSKRVLSDIVFAGFLDWYWAKPNSTQPMMRIVHGYCGRALLNAGKN